MITEYKVVEPFGSLKKGDTLVREDNGMFTFKQETSDDTQNFYSLNVVSINENVAAEYAKSGLLTAVVDTESINNDDNRIKEIAQLIAQLKNTYNQRKNNIEKKYKEGKIHSCVKLEHDTVYFNMMKLLNKFESIINE